MSELWNNVIVNLQIVLAFLTQVFGGNLGFAIITLSCSVRFALLPLTLRIAQRMQERQRILQALQPELERLKSRYGDNPDQLARETLKLYRQKGVRMFDLKSIGGTLLQMPVMAALYSVISKGVGVGKRFFWIRDLAQPDLLLGLLVGVLTMAMSLLSPSLQSQTKLVMLLVPSIITLVIVCQLSSGLGLYWAASNVVGLVQSAILRQMASKSQR